MIIVNIDRSLKKWRLSKLMKESVHAVCECFGGRRILGSHRIY